MVSGLWKEREIKEGQDGNPILILQLSSLDLVHLCNLFCFGISFGRFRAHYYVQYINSLVQSPPQKIRIIVRQYFPVFPAVFPAVRIHKYRVLQATGMIQSMVK